MTHPRTLDMLARQAVALSYRRTADACLAAAEAWSEVDPGVVDADGHHRRAVQHLDRAADAIVRHDAVAAGLARGRG